MNIVVISLLPLLAHSQQFAVIFLDKGVNGDKAAPCSHQKVTVDTVRSLLNKIGV